MIPFLSFKKTPQNFDLGNEVFSWQAFDYHPHERGTLWYVVFCAVFFGGALWAILSDPKWGWLTAFVFFVAGGVYFWKHREGEQVHEIQVFENGISIDGQNFPRNIFHGYWFVIDAGVSVINLELTGDKEEKISLQMGEKSADFFRENFIKIELEELREKKESLLDLWIRALKL